MTAAAPAIAPAKARILQALPDKASEKWAVAGLFAVIALQFTQVFRRSINWDEFWHYSQIHQLHAGVLAKPLQTLHTRLYSWVTDLPGTGVDHIVVIRLFMFGCEMIAVAGIIGLASRFAGRTAAILAALAYLSFPYVFQHGYSFRFDPPAAALMTSTLWLLSRSSLRWPAIVLGGAMIGTAAMVTIKIVLLAPAFAGVVWLRWNEQGRSFAYVARLAAMGAVALAVFAAIFALHSQGLAGDNADQARAIIGGSGSLMFRWEVKPYWMFAIAGAIMAPLVTVLIALFPRRAMRGAFARDEKVALVGLFLPLTTLIFYHNTAPYYYVFMLPTVLAASAISMPWLTEKFAVAGTAALLALFALVSWGIEEESPITKQRMLLEVADRAFPPGTHYFDFMGFLGSQPKSNPFMTTAVIKGYLEQGRPLHLEAMANHPVPLLIDNDVMFQRLLHTREPIEGMLLEEAAALRDTYIPFWGPYWLAGEEFAAGAAPREFIVRVPGTYTVYDAPITLDGSRLEPGDTVALERGSYTASTATGAHARLIWGSRIAVPAETPPDLPHFQNF